MPTTRNTPHLLRKQSNKFVRYMKLPIKILSRARDFYVSSLTGCAGHSAFYGNAMGCPASLPRSFSTHSSYSPDRSYDTRELLKVASARGLTGKTESELIRSRKSAVAVIRSRTVGIGRIDEDKPCEFAEYDVGERAPVVYPRSRSYATAYSGQKSQSKLVRNEL